MPRRARRDLDSSYLHVIVQGIEKKYIFEKELYKKEYKKLLISKSKVFKVKILAYCIMDNHAHMLVYSSDIKSIGKMMQSVNTTFAHFYNRVEKRVGYVFRNRFISEPIRSEGQLYNCLSYIHFNPVKAGMVDSVEKYYYSSYKNFIYKNGIVDDETIKLVFGSIFDYLSMFYFIHGGIGQAKEPYEKEIVGYDNITIGNINTPEKFASECKRLKEMSLSNRKIAQLLGVGRNRVNRTMQNECQ